MKSCSCIAVLALVLGAGVAEAQAAAKPIDVTLSEWKIQMPSDTVAAGTVTFRITNTGGVAHALYVLGGNVAEGTREIAPRQSATFKVALKAGEYEIYCPLSDQSHKMAGMSRKLIVVNRAQ